MNDARWLVPFRRWGTLPFEFLIGWLALLSGLLGLIGAKTSLDPLDQVLAPWAFYTFQGAYALAGLALLVGLAASRREVEAFGLALIATSVLVRGVAQADLIGFTRATWVAISFDIVAAVCCWARMRQLRRGEVIIRLETLRRED